MQSLAGWAIIQHARVRTTDNIDALVTIPHADVIVDFLRPVIPAYSHVLDRAMDAQIFGQNVRISSPERLIAMKLIAMRPQDEADIQELLAAYSGKLDLDFVRAELESFSDANDPRRAKFEGWVSEQIRKDQD